MAMYVYFSGKHVFLKIMSILSSHKMLFWRLPFNIMFSFVTYQTVPKVLKAETQKEINSLYDINVAIKKTYI